MRFDISGLWLHFLCFFFRNAEIVFLSFAIRFRSSVCCVQSEWCDTSEASISATVRTASESSSVQDVIVMQGTNTMMLDIHNGGNWSCQDEKGP